MQRVSGIPILGLGTYPLRGGECRDAVKMAVDCGVRHIDTAQMYGNERDVGEAVKACGIPRKELYVVTKVDPGNAKPKAFAASVKKSMDDLNGPSDLLLIHWPPADSELDQMLDDLQQAKADGLTREIGVSNFSPSRMRRAQTRLKGQVMNNQVEFHPLLDQSGTLAVAKELKIALSAYSPIARGKALKPELVVRLSKKHSRPASAIVLRWIMQQGVIAIPMTTKRENMTANLQALEFELDDGDMNELTQLGSASGKTIAPSWMADRWD